MVIMPNGEVFVATPRTASRAIMEAIMRAYPKSINTYPENHHVHPDEVPTTLGKVYGVIRNPYTHLISWFNNTFGGDGDTFQAFLDNYENFRFFPGKANPWPGGYRLNMYAGVITDFLLFEDGVEAALDEMKVPKTFIDVVGKTEKRPYIYNNGRFKEQIERDFAADLALYRRIYMEKHGV